MEANKTFIKLVDKDYSNLDNLSTNLGISNLTAKVLINRGINTFDDCSQFLNPKLEDFYDPFLLNDMDKGVARILQSISNNENIWVYGDYDVDGVTSTSLLKLFFKQLGIDVSYYIPDRFTEGYGLNKDAIDYILDKKGQLIITVDCGITSLDVVNYCNENGIDIIITDHHHCQEKLPQAVAVINPNREDNKYPFTKLAGVGVALKLIQALAMKLDIAVNYDQLLPIAAIGTVADVVSLTDENRVIVKNGLSLINSTPNFGIQALLAVTGLKEKKINSGHIGFVIGPRINATGRLKSAKYGVELLISKTMEDAMQLAQRLDDENKKRQNIEADILMEAEDIIRREIDLDNERVLVVASENWHHGVIGIVSSRLTEKYYRPSILISIEDGEGRGSARSIPMFDMFDGLNRCKELFNKFGGHKQAAGLSLDKENIKILRKEMNKIATELLTEEDLIPEISVDSEIKSDELTMDNVSELNALEPFGMGNPSPIFLCRNAKINMIRQIGKEKNHLKLNIQLDNLELDCVGFNLGYLNENINIGDIVDIAGSLDINQYKGNENLQLIIKEIKSKYESLNTLDNQYYSSLNKSFFNGSKELKINDYNGIKIINNKDRVDYLIKLLIKSEKTMVFINNYKNAQRLLSDIEVRGRDFKKRVTISYNRNDDSTKNSIVINPILREINFNDYKTFILYDMCFDENVYCNIIDMFREKDLIILLDKKDIEINNEVLVDIIPSVDDLRVIYKSFIGKYEVFKLNVFDYINNLIKNTNIVLNKGKLELALEVLKDGNLINFKKINNDFFYIKLLRNNCRIDIQKLPSYTYLNKLKANKEYITKLYI